MTTFKRASWLIALLALVPPILYAYLGSFSRMIHDDDYGIMLIGQEKGAWEGMLYWYNTWTGSYTVRFLRSAIAPLDVLATSLMPPLIVLLWLVGTYWLVCQGLACLGISHSRRPLAISISALSVAAAIHAFYSPQSFYWYSASTAYGLPIAFFTIHMALSVWMAQRLRKNMRSLLGLIALGMIGFLVAGFSEMYLVFQLTLFTFCLLASFAFLERSARSGYVSVFVAAWLGTLVSLFVQLSSPGSAKRAEIIVNQSGPPDRSAERLLFGTLKEALGLTGHQAVFVGFIMLMGVGVLVMLIAYQPQLSATASKAKSGTLGLPLPPPPPILAARVFTEASRLVKGWAHPVLSLYFRFTVFNIAELSLSPLPVHGHPCAAGCIDMAAVIHAHKRGREKTWFAGALFIRPWMGITNSHYLRREFWNQLDCDPACLVSQRLAAGLLGFDLGLLYWLCSPTSLALRSSLDNKTSEAGKPPRGAGHRCEHRAGSGGARA